MQVLKQFTGGFYEADNWGYKPSSDDNIEVEVL